MLATNEEWNRIKDEIRSDRHDAEYYLLNYDEEMKRYEDAKRESLDTPDGEKVGGKSNLPGHPTEDAALRSIGFDESYEPYSWLKAVEIVQRGIGERKSIFLSIRRKVEKDNARAKGQRSWVTTTQMRFANALEERFFVPDGLVSEKTVRTYWHDIVSRVIDVHSRIKNKKKDR